MTSPNKFVRFLAHTSVVAALTSLLLMGCNRDAGPKTEVVGKVMYKSQPVSGTLSFIPDAADGLPYTVPSGSDGSFATKGVAPGSYTVTVQSGTPKGPPGQTAPPAYKMPANADPALKDLLPPGAAGGSGVSVPAKYSDSKKSDWKVTINQGKNDLGTFELKD